MIAYPGPGFRKVAFHPLGLPLGEFLLHVRSRRAGLQSQRVTAEVDRRLTGGVQRQVELLSEVAQRVCFVQGHRPLVQVVHNLYLGPKDTNS